MKHEAEPETIPTATPPKQDSIPDEFIDAKELIKRIPISRRTVFNLRKRKAIPCVNLGDRVLFHWPSVREWLLRSQS